MTAHEAITDAVRAAVDRYISGRTWREVCAKEMRANLPHVPRKLLEDFIRAQYDAAGAGFSGRWQ